MTRENKLALVVGFGLILFIGILISDHFSVARNQSSANLTSREIADPLVGRSRNEPDLIAIKPEPPAPPMLQPADAAMNTSQMANNGAGNQPIESMTPEQRSGIARDVYLSQGGSNANPEGRNVPRDVEPVNTLEPRSGNAELTALNTRVEETSELPGFVKVSDEMQVDLKDLRFHDVRGGESLFAICKQYYGSTDLVNALAKFNKMDDPAQVRAGRRLVIPTEETLTGKPKKAPASPPAKPQQPSTSALRNTAMAANTDKPANAKAGDAKAKAKATAQANSKTNKAATQTYTVKAGDSLSGIAQRLLGDREKWRDLAKINRKVIDDPDNIRAGTVLKLG